MAFSDVMQTLGRYIGLYSDAEPGRDAPVYDEYGQPEMDYDPGPSQEDMGYQSGYGSGTSYVRAGARPARHPVAPRYEEQGQGMFGRGKQQPRQAQPRQAQPRQAAAGQAQYLPDNVIPMPEREARGGGASAAGPTQSSTIIFCVRRKDDSSQIINYLLRGVNVILNFEEVDDVQCQRVLDMVSGAAYALRASLERISHRNYLVAPTGVEIVRSETQGRETRDMRDIREMREARDSWEGYEEHYATRY